MTYGISWPLLSWLSAPNTASLKSEIGRLGFYLVLLWKEASIFFLAKTNSLSKEDWEEGENVWGPVSAGKCEEGCGRLTFQFTKGNRIPRENKPSIGPPHMPWMLRAACGSKQIRSTLHSPESVAHLGPPPFLDLRWNTVLVLTVPLINHVLSGNHFSILGSLISTVYVKHQKRLQAYVCEGVRVCVNTHRQFGFGRISFPSSWNLLICLYFLSYQKLFK